MFCVSSEDTQEEKVLFFSNALLSSKFSLLDCFWKKDLGLLNIYFLVGRGCRRDTVGIKVLLSGSRSSCSHQHLWCPTPFF